MKLDKRSRKRCCVSIVLDLPDTMCEVLTVDFHVRRHVVCGECQCYYCGMNARVIEWLSKVTDEIEFQEPVVEFGSMQTPGQTGYADARRFFYGLKYIGCDLEEGPGVDLVCDIERAPFGPDEVGTVICLETLEHVKHPWLAVQEVFRILKPGGLFLVSVPFRIPIHSFPEDYWRMTAKGIEVLLRAAGFAEIQSSDSGEELEWDVTWDIPEENIVSMPYPHISFAVARKEIHNRAKQLDRIERASTFPEMDRLSLTKTIEQKRRGKKGARARERVEIVVPVFHREEDTRLMFKQLSRVTDDYDLIIVDNGFDDPDFLNGLKPIYHIENDENTGAIRPVNQGLDVAQGKYVCVLHNDLLIFDDGWLDHIIEFMERRPDVGIVGLAGRHTIEEDGSLDLDTTVVDIRDYPLSHKPTWRVTEVAAIDGLGWVMRNTGFRLEESYGLMHFYDLDISLQYIEAGYRVYMAAIEIVHLAADEDRSTRSMDTYLDRIGGDDKVYYEEVKEKFRIKWQHMLPITRGFQDEFNAYHRITELNKQSEDLEKAREDSVAFAKHIEEAYRDLEVYTRHVEQAGQNAVSEIEKWREETEKLRKIISESSETVGGIGKSAPSVFARFWSSIRNEGILATGRRTARYLVNKICRTVH